MQDTQWSIKVVSKLWRRPLQATYEGNALSVDDAQLLRKSLTLRVLLLADLASEPSAGVVRNFMRTVGSITQIDVEQYASSWATLKEWVVREVAENYSTYFDAAGCSVGFKRRPTWSVPYRWIGNSVIELMEEGVRYESLLQWVVFDEKLNMNSLDLSNRYEVDYVETEESLSQFDYDLPSAFVELASESLARFEVQLYPFRPFHGPGATREVLRSQACFRSKNERLWMSPRVVRYLHWRYASEDDDDSGWFLNQISDEDSPRECELVCVPKSLVKNRTISKEPTTLQYLQQDLFMALDEWISSDPLFRYHIDLHNQDLSRDLALAGSRAGAYATIDMSKASDLVTLALLEALAPDSGLVRALRETRSEICVLPSGARCQIGKLAGMGNATCFPAECLVFALCCEYACRVTGMVDTRYCYRVFGDDIVIRSEAVPALYEVLEACHFIVNRDKSFDTSPAQADRIFREACGIWCLSGLDVTPIRLSRRLVWSTRHDVQPVPQVLGWIALCNETFQYGFMNLNRGIHAALREQPWYNTIARVGYLAHRHNTARSLPVPYFITWDDNATQWNCDRRWNSSYQRMEIRVNSVICRSKAIPRDDNDLLSYWIHAAREEDWSSEEEPQAAEGAEFRPTRSSLATAGTSRPAWVRKWVLEP